MLEVYGSDRTRWPADARAGAGQLVARDRAARRLLAEAEAWPRPGARACALAHARGGAGDRIAAAAQRSLRIVRFQQRADCGAPAASKATCFGFRLARTAAWRSATVLGGAASFLAASLAIGILLGFSSLPQPLAPAFQELSGMVGDHGRYNLALVDPLDEDLL